MSFTPVTWASAPAPTLPPAFSEPRRVIPGTEGRYTVKFPEGDTERTRRFLAARGMAPGAVKVVEGGVKGVFVPERRESQLSDAPVPFSKPSQIQDIASSSRSRASDNTSKRNNKKKINNSIRHQSAPRDGTVFERLGGSGSANHIQSGGKRDSGLFHKAKMITVVVGNAGVVREHAVHPTDLRVSKLSGGGGGSGGRSNSSRRGPIKKGGSDAGKPSIFERLNKKV